jgi:hypothetical protein
LRLAGLGNPWFDSLWLRRAALGLPQQKQGLKKPPKSRLTKIRHYCTISYVSQQNSDQGCRADQAGAGAGAGGMGNSPKAACGLSYTSYLSFMSHQCPAADPAPFLKKPAKNSLLGAVPMKAAEGK